MLYNHQQMSAVNRNFNIVKGFTIVELLIVIAIISILTVMTTISYSKIQVGSRDSSVRDAAKRFGLALQSFASDTGKTPLQTGGGWGGLGSGFVSDLIYDPTYYPVSVESVLRNAGYIDADFTQNLPPNKQYNSSGYTLMLYACGSKYVVYYSLESPTSKDISDFNYVKTQCGNAASVQTSYNMQGGYIFS